MGERNYTGERFARGLGLTHFCKPCSKRSVNSCFDETSNSLNAFLADKALMQVNSVSVIDGSSSQNSLSKLGVLDAFVYGELSHLNKRVDYNNFTSSPLETAFYSMESASILKQLINYILAISKLNREVITDLSANSQAFGYSNI